jgi:cell division protein FtsZ
MAVSSFSNVNLSQPFETTIPSFTEIANTGTDSAVGAVTNQNPQVVRQNPNRRAVQLNAASSPQAKAMLVKGADFFEIPAFLRKQAD